MLSESAKEQATNLQSSVQAVEEITSTIDQNTNNANLSEKLSKDCLVTAENGRGVIRKMVQSMSDINQGNQDILSQVEDGNKKMNEILIMITEIENKTQLINDIVFQTKLLSFNASVEAARAGEHGKGFAVVAEEIGNLAQSSGNSAKQISDLLSESLAKVQSIIKETNDKVGHVSVLGRERVKIGQLTAEECSLVFDQIVKGFSQVAALVSDISNASNEQNIGIGEINKTMLLLNSVTDKTTQISIESSDSAIKLESSAKTLENVVKNLQSVIQGAKKS
jgi:methyl-accepting chemotaxis protein